MDDSIKLSLSALERLLPLCLEFAHQISEGQSPDVPSLAKKVGESLGIPDIGEYMKRHFAGDMKDGLQLIFDAKDAKAVATIFAKMCKPTMELIYSYVQGGKDAADLMAGLNEICFAHGDALCAALQSALGVPAGVADALANKFGPLAVSIYCFAGTFKIYQKAAKDAAIAKAHRLEVERLCNESIARLKDERAKMDALLQEYMLDRLLPFSEGVAAIDQAIIDGDDDGYIKANAQLWKLFGRDAQYRDATEFDKLMLSDDAFRL